MIETSLPGEGKLNVLDYFIYSKGRLKLKKYRMNKKHTCFESLLKIQQQKWRLVNKTEL